MVECLLFMGYIQRGQGPQMGLRHRLSNFNPDPHESPQTGHFQFVLDLFMRKGHFSATEVQSTHYRGCDFMTLQGLGNVMYLAATAEFSLWYNLTPLITGSRAGLQIQQHIWSRIVSVQSNLPREHLQDGLAGCVFSKGDAELELLHTFSCLLLLLSFGLENKSGNSSTC